MKLMDARLVNIRPNSIKTMANIMARLYTCPHCCPGQASHDDIEVASMMIGVCIPFANTRPYVFCITACLLGNTYMQVCVRDGARDSAAWRETHWDLHVGQYHDDDHCGENTRNGTFQKYNFPGEAVGPRLKENAVPLTSLRHCTGRCRSEQIHFYRHYYGMVNLPDLLPLNIKFSSWPEMFRVTARWPL